jgi:hypothetical protein
MAFDSEGCGAAVCNANSGAHAIAAIATALVRDRKVIGPV